MILLYSILLRVFSALILWCLARGFGISLPLLAYFFVDVIVTVAHVAGSHFIGVVGSFEASLAYVLTLFDASKEVGLGIALLTRVTFVVPLAVLGSLFFFSQGLSWADVKRLQGQAAGDSSAETETGPVAQSSLPFSKQ